MCVCVGGGGGGAPVVASDLKHYEPHLWLVGFSSTMQSGVVLICSCVVDV